MKSPIRDEIVKQLKSQYENLVQQYITIFRDKHNLKFEQWISKTVGMLAQFDNCYVDFDNIRFDLENDQPKEYLTEWLKLCVKNGSKFDCIGYEQFCKNKSNPL